MTQSQLFSTAHKIASYKDTDKVGNKIFRFLPNQKYRTKFAAALKYLYKIEKQGYYFTQGRGLNAQVTAKKPTMKQWDFLQRNRVECGANYNDFCEKYSRKEASSLIGSVIRHKEDGYTFAYKVN